MGNYLVSVTSLPSINHDNNTADNDSTDDDGYDIDK